MVDLGLGGDALRWSYREGEQEGGDSPGRWICRVRSKRGLGEAHLIWVVLLLIVKLMGFMRKNRIIWAEYKYENNIVIGVSCH